MQCYVSFLLLLCSCGFTIAQADCPNLHDSNSDGAVTISDLLDLLGLFGDIDTDQDGVWDSVDDCLDTSACNYASDPTEPCAYFDVLGECGGGCEGDGDGDGICDDIDTCVGIEDECGVCNGPGPTEVVIESITILYDSVYAEQIDTWFVFEVGADTIVSFYCAPPCGEQVGYYGYDYNTVAIGEQCWFIENLQNAFYRNGDAIPALTDYDWWSTNNGAQAIYQGPFDALGSGYGRLYNGYAVQDDRLLCPSGWHVPTNEEWLALLEFLGGSSGAGTKLKTVTGWSPNGGTNESGFTARAGGSRSGLSGSGQFNGYGTSGFWWSSSPWSRLVLLSHYASASIASGGNSIENYGLSVRCLKDSE